MPADTPTRAAIVYDFDGTLSRDNMQEHSLIPGHLGVPVAEFWERVGRDKRTHDADQILTYMRLLLEYAREAGRPITEAILREHAKSVPYFQGVDSWFGRIDAHARERGLLLEHYVVSSGNEEMIQGCSIAPHFRRIFGCRYVYDDDGHAVWPAVAVNYTTKTQYLFRINKGVMSHWDNEPVNRWIPMEERPLPFTRMIYLGDGDTDIPSMKMVRHQGGHSIAVFDPAKWAQRTAQGKVYSLISEDRANHVVPADYTENSQLDVVVKGILGRIARESGYREPGGQAPRT